MIDWLAQINILDQQVDAINMITTRDAGPMSGKCWPTVFNAGTALNQQRVKVWCFLVEHD